MELLDIYDEDLNYLGTEDRNIVHRDGLWHQTVHCWLYDKEGNIYFQIRSDEGTLYTTASGHIKAHESIKEAFGREIYEEIGYKCDYENAGLIDVVKWKMDKVKKDGSIFKDRAYANVYACLFEGDISKFNFDNEEVLGLGCVNALKTLELFEGKRDHVTGKKIITKNHINVAITYDFKVEDFLVNEGEDVLTKYGDALRYIIKKGEANEKD